MPPFRSLLISLSFLTLPLPALAQTLPAPACNAPALARLTPHTSTAGQTIAAIAAQYQLLPETIAHFNPRFSRTSALPVGSTVLIPPYNGIQITTPNGATWKDLANSYGVRADVLFEVNGCQKAPGAVAFIPHSQAGRPPGSINSGDLYEGLSRSPLTIPLQQGLGYGWYQRGEQGQTFHNGLDLLAPVGTSVQAAAPGIVAFTGLEGDYGYLVVINHAAGRQTRYAHLGAIAVNMGDSVEAGQRLGTVGTSGRPDLATPHLHFEVRQQAPVGWVAQDPTLHLPPDVEILAAPGG
ncbi:MAG: M23 family metallopeptidase [Spirulina sp. SIO3F2]|nr:M23 family metallopeptidase [Spirulina sp. SIO3F2]